MGLIGSEHSSSSNNDEANPSLTSDTATTLHPSNNVDIPNERIQDSNSSPLTSPIFDPLGLSSSTSTDSDPLSLSLQFNHPSSRILGISSPPQHQSRNDNDHINGEQRQSDLAVGQSEVETQSKVNAQTEPSPKRGRKSKRKSRDPNDMVDASMATSPASLTSNWWDREAVKQELEQRHQSQDRDGLDASQSQSGSESDSNSQFESRAKGSIEFDEGKSKEGIEMGKTSSSSSRLDSSPGTSHPSKPNLRLRSPFETKHLSPERVKDESGSQSQSQSINSSPPSISQSPSNASISIRSPAADFLSAFSSMHSVVPSPSNSFVDDVGGGGSLDSNQPQSLLSAIESTIISNSPMIKSQSENKDGDRNHSSNSSLNFHSYGCSAPDQHLNQHQPNWNGLSRIANQLYSSTDSSNNSKRSPNHPFNLQSLPLRPDDEGARIGPNGRYLLGKNIGFGGFSTIREGWDLGDGEEILPSNVKEGEDEIKEQLGRRVAVKLVYNKDEEKSEDDTSSSTSTSQELTIWRSLPSHPHLLPLLHHERLCLDGLSTTTNPSSKSKNYADVLIMPFCDRGSLLDFVRSEGGRRFSQASKTGTGNGLPMSSSSSFNGIQDLNHLSRSNSLSASLSGQPSNSNSNSNSTSTSGGQIPSRPSSIRSPSSFTPISGRTGSGFIPRGNKPNPISRTNPPSLATSFSSSIQGINSHQDEESRINPHHPNSLNQTSTNRLTSPSPFSPSTSIGRSPSLSSSTILRRASSRAPPPPRSQGVSLHQAKDVLSQITSALLCLHSKAGIRHGDIKLENVLGQSAGIGKGNQKRRRRDSSEDSEEVDDSNDLLLSPLSPESEGFQNLNPTEAIFWRLADFGLAEKVIETSPINNSSSSPGKSRKARREENKSLSEGIFSKEKEGRTGSKTTLNQGGSLAYTPPEVLRSDPTINVVPDLQTSTVGSIQDEVTSPFTSDMWALGCILYALLSGRLPFADSFEPRLQMKIAKAQWEMPPRLKRRVERLASQQIGGNGGQVTSNPSSPMIGPSNSFSSFSGFRDVGRERSGSIELSSRPNFAPSKNGNHSIPPIVDLSASLPSLPPPNHSHQRNLSANHHIILINNSNPQIVGSAPSAPDPKASNMNDHSHLEIDSRARLIAEHEADPESDQDERMTNDFDWNGNSNDRAEAREVLNGLLNPDPKSRWNVHQLSTCRWLRGFGPLSGIHGSSATGLGINNNDLSSSNAKDFVSSSQFGSSQISNSNNRPSLANLPISENPSQERVAQLKDQTELQKEREREDESMMATSPLIERIARANGLDTRIGRIRTPPPSLNDSNLDRPFSPSRSRSKSLAAAHRNKRDQIPADNPSYSSQNNNWNNSSTNFSQSMVTASSRWGGRVRPEAVESEDDDEEDRRHLRRIASNDEGLDNSFLPQRYTSGPNQEAQHSWGGRAPSPLDRNASEEINRGRRSHRMADVDEDSVWAINHQHQQFNEGERDGLRGRQSPAIPISISRDASRSPVGFRSQFDLGTSSTSSSNRRNRSTDSHLTNSRINQSGRSTSRDTADRYSSSSSRSRSQMRPYSLSTTNTTSTLATSDGTSISSPIENPHSSNNNSSKPKTSNIHAERSSSSRSRSRAPDALAHILRESSRDRSGSGSRSGSGRSRSRNRDGNTPISAGGTSLEEEREGDNDEDDGGKKDNWWERGRGRERKEPAGLSRLSK